jgi:hypothetical protein
MHENFDHTHSMKTAFILFILVMHPQVCSLIDDKQGTVQAQWKSRQIWNEIINLDY